MEPITDYGTSMYDPAIYNMAIFSSGVFWMFSLAVMVITLVSMWKIFTKAGYAGWKSIVPIYNAYCLFKMTWGNGWLFLLTIVPVVGTIVYIMTTYRLAKAFGKGLGFCLGLLFLSVIFYPLLAFSDAQYNASVTKK